MDGFVDTYETCYYIAEKIKWLDTLNFPESDKRILYVKNAKAVLDNTLQELRQNEYKMVEWRAHYLSGRVAGAVEMIERLVG